MLGEGGEQAGRVETQTAAPKVGGGAVWELGQNRSKPYRPTASSGKTRIACFFFFLKK